MLRMSRISKKPLKTWEVKKQVACYHLENEFSTFSTFDMSSNEFLTHQLDLVNSTHRCRFILDITNLDHEHTITTAVAQGHPHLILHNLHERGTIHYCLNFCCFHTISILPLCTAQNVSVFIGLPCILKKYFLRTYWKFPDY